MSERAILVGVGGTGCKCLESVVHVIASGLISVDCELLFVDQDKNNNCTGRAKRVAEDYSKFLDVLDDSRYTDKKTKALATRLKVHKEILQPLPSIDETLQSAFSIRSQPGTEHVEYDDAWLMRSLFTEAERTASMNNGFRARPAVGAAAYAVSIAKEGPTVKKNNSASMWAAIVDAVSRAVDNATGLETIHVVFFGSIFGGTGAAGLPSLGRRLREYAADKKFGNVRVSAVLMLPYYCVSPPENETNPYGPVPSGQVRLALEYYAELMKAKLEERPFETAYLIGISEHAELPYDEQGGGGGQQNAPLAPELVAALGAAKLLATNPGSGAVFYCSRENENRITLNDLPYLSSQYPKPGDALIDLMRCGLAFMCAYYPIFWSISKNKSRFVDFPFLRNYITLKQIRMGENAFNSARNYFRSLFVWASALEVNNPGRTITPNQFSQNSVDLEFFSSETFTDPGKELRFGLSSDAPSVLRTDEVNEIKQAFQSLRSDEKRLEMQVVLARLADPPSRKDFKRGTRGMVEAIYQASRLEFS